MSRTQHTQLPTADLSSTTVIETERLAPEDGLLFKFANKYGVPASLCGGVGLGTGLIVGMPVAPPRKQEKWEEKKRKQYWVDKGEGLSI